MRPWSRLALEPAEWGVLALIALCGLVTLPWPFTGDQALFAVVARELDAGAVLYRDVWDSKQPGIFLFYWLAGRLFGFTETGAHVLELLYLLAFALVLLRTARGYLERRAARLALPLLAVGLHYAIARPKCLVQVESLVGFPLYLTLWLSAGRAERGVSPRRAFAAGLAGGAVIGLKLYFAPLVAACLAPALWSELRAGRGRQAPRRLLGPWLAGIGLPVLAFVGWAASRGVLREALWTYFVYPRQMAEALDFQPARAAQTVTWFLGAAAVSCLWTLVGSVPGAGRRAAVCAGAGLWALLGAAQIALQVSFWKYYMLVLLVPLALLACSGIERAARWRSSWVRASLALATLLALIGPARQLASSVGLLLRHRLALSAADRTALRCAASDMYRPSLEQAEYLRRVAAPGDGVYVLGHPLILFLSGRRDAIPINGWSPEAWGAPMWERVAAQLVARRPEHVFVAGRLDRSIRKRAPDLWTMLLHDYAAHPAGAAGRWYGRRDRSRGDVREP